MLMAYPDGVQQIKCPGCAMVNNTPPTETAMNMGAAARGAGIDPAFLAQLPEDLRQQILKSPICTFDVVTEYCKSCKALNFGSLC